MATKKTKPAEPTAAEAAEKALMQMLAGAWVTRTIATAARLGIPDALAAGPRTPQEIAAKAGTDAGATKRLMRALSGLGVFAEEGGRYRLTEMGDRLREDFPGSLKHMFIAETDTVHSRSWEKILDSVRTGLPRSQDIFQMPVFDYYARNRAEGEQFGRAMEAVSGFVSRAILDAYDFKGLRTIVDVGGGNGSMVLSILERYPAIRGIVYDLPYISDQAQATIQAAKMSDRCRFEPGDFFRSVPKGADAHLLKFILHDWNDDQATTLLRACRAAIDPDGRLLVLEVIVPDEENRPDFSHLMDLNMLVMTGGMERTAREYEKLLYGAGWRLERIVPTASPFSLIEGRPA